MASGLEFGCRFPQPRGRRAPAVIERSGRDEPPGQMIPPRSEGSEDRAAFVGEVVGKLAVPIPALENCLRIAEISLIPADGGARLAYLIDRHAPVLAKCCLQDRVVAPGAAGRQQCGVASVGGPPL